MIVPGQCWFCGQPDTARHAWDCVPSRHTIRHLVEGLCTWLQNTWYMDRLVVRHVVKEMWGASYLIVWCMATTTDGFRQDGLSVATQDSIGVEFLKRVVDASMRLHKHRYTHREDSFRRKHPQLQTAKRWRHGLWECKNRGQKVGEEEGEREPEEEGSEAEPDEAD